MADDYRVGFAPLDEEVSTELPVVGAMPPWLCGSLIRNGPARYAVGDPPQRYRHWFDGLAMLHRFVLDDGKVQYANRFLRSRTYQHAVEHGEIGYGEFGTSPDRSLLDTVASAVSGPAYSDNANVNVLQVGGRHVAVTETPTPIAFDPETLETVGPLDWEDDLPGYVTTGHPHHDPQRAALINYTVEFGRSSSYHLYEFPDGSLQRRLIGSVPVDEPAYMHSFVMTEHYVVLVEYPYLANPLSLRVSPRPFIESYRWRPERGTRFTVVDRRTGEVVRRATTDAFFCSTRSTATRTRTGRRS